MRIQLDENFALNSDRYCVWISKKRATKKGKNAGQEYHEAYDGYHKNVEDCFDSFLDHQQKLAHSKVRGAKKESSEMENILEDITVKELVKTTKDAKKQIKEWCKVIDREIKLIKTDAAGRE